MITFVKKDWIKDYFNNKRVAIFGSAPNCLDNDGQEINKYDIIVRVNNYKIKGYESHVGSRTDVHYAFYGSSIRKTKEELINDGVKLCMCKCPNAYLFDHNVPWDPKNHGSDFRWIYHNRKDFWFCPVYVPTKEDFMNYYDALNGHIPTTGYACILDIIQCNPSELYITGFDGFTTKIHNVNELWREKHRDDPIAHMPNAEQHLIRALDILYPFIKLAGSFNDKE